MGIILWKYWTHNVNTALGIHFWNENYVPFCQLLPTYKLNHSLTFADECMYKLGRGRCCVFYPLLITHIGDQLTPHLNDTPITTTSREERENGWKGSTSTTQSFRIETF